MIARTSRLSIPTLRSMDRFQTTPSQTQESSMNIALQESDKRRLFECALQKPSSFQIRGQGGLETSCNWRTVTTATVTTISVQTMCESQCEISQNSLRATNMCVITVMVVTMGWLHENCSCNYHCA